MEGLGLSTTVETCIRYELLMSRNNLLCFKLQDFFMYTDNKQLDDITQDSTWEKSQLDKYATENIWRFGGKNKEFSIILLKETRSIVE